MRSCRREIFGPVVCAVLFTDVGEVLPAANDSIYNGPAAGGLHSTLQGPPHRRPAGRAGSVWINCYNIFDAALPFGGDKQSGWGREMGHHVLQTVHRGESRHRTAVERSLGERKDRRKEYKLVRACG